MTSEARAEPNKITCFELCLARRNSTKSNVEISDTAFRGVLAQASDKGVERHFMQLLNCVTASNKNKQCTEQVDGIKGTGCLK